MRRIAFKKTKIHHIRDWSNNMDFLAGMDNDTGRIIGPQEQTTRQIVDDLKAKHPEPDPIRDGLCQSMISLAANIDAQNRTGKEISRNMGQYIDALWKLRDMYPTETVADDDVEAVWSGATYED